MSAHSLLLLLCHPLTWSVSNGDVIHIRQQVSSKNLKTFHCPWSHPWGLQSGHWYKTLNAVWVYSCLFHLVGCYKLQRTQKIALHNHCHEHRGQILWVKKIMLQVYIESGEETLDPVHPNISMHILIAVLYKFPEVLTQSRR